jgi:hypothetical protein
MKDNDLIFKNISGSIDDVFFNDFDRTWLKSDPNGPEPDRIYTKLPIEVAYDDGNVLYEYNKDFLDVMILLISTTAHISCLLAVQKAKGWELP